MHLATLHPKFAHIGSSHRNPFLKDSHSGNGIAQPSSISPHLNRNKIEYNLSAPGIQEHQENTLMRSFNSNLWIRSGFRLALKGCWCCPTDISSGGSFRNSYRGRSRGILGFQVHSSWIQSVQVWGVKPEID